MRRRESTPPFAPVLDDDVEHVKNDGKISDEQSTPPEGDSPKKLTDLEGQQKCSGNEGHPLGPGPFLPQAVRFGETQGRVSEGYAGGDPQTRIGDAIGEVQEYLRRTPVCADVQKRQQAFGDQPGIPVEQSDGANPHQHDEYAFGELQASHGAKHAPLTDMGICFLSVRTHERRHS